MPHSDIAKLIDDYRDAFNKHDVAQLADLYTDDCVRNDSLFGSLHGKDAIREYYTALFNAFPDMGLSINTAIGSPDLLAMEASASGTNKGPLPPPLNLPATNHRVDIAKALFMTLRDGKIAMENVYTDYGVMLEQLGLTPKEAEAPPKKKEAGK